MRGGTSATLMWSTVTLTPTCWPQSATNWSNHSSWLGTKWLHIRMERFPESCDVGSTKVGVGDASPASVPLVPGRSGSPAQEAAARPTVARPVVCSICRRVQSRWIGMRHTPPSGRRPNRLRVDLYVMQTCPQQVLPRPRGGGKCGLGKRRALTPKCRGWTLGADLVYWGSHAASPDLCP